MVEEIDAEKWQLYISALTKSMRRGLEDDSLYWASVLYRIGKAKQVWRRLLIHTSEDVGPAEFNLPANVRALCDNYRDLHDHADAVLPYLHAVSLIARSSKSRIIDHAKIIYCIDELENRPVPDYAKDHHGKIGREMGRGVEYFFDVASQLSPETIHDPYKEQAREIAIKIQKEKSNQ